MSKPDPTVVETQRVYAEYDEARALWEADRKDPFIRARFDRAQQALHGVRRTWREIGHVAGTRDPQSPVGVTDNEAQAPTLIPQEA